MSNKKIPVIDIMDFSGVTIDAVVWNRGVYTVMFNFWKNIDASSIKNDKVIEGDDGMIVCTHMEGASLEACWAKIQLALSSDIFEGTDIYLYGNLWSEDGECLHDIDWTDYCDEATADRLLGESIIEEELSKYQLIDRYPISATVH